MPTIKRKQKTSKEQVASEYVKPKKKTTHKSTWKHLERKCSKDWGTKRVPLSGSNSGHGTNSDSLHTEIYLECKLRAKFWGWGLFEDTEKKAKVEKKIPAVVIKEKGKKGELYLVRRQDIIALAKIMEKMQEEEEK